MKEALEEEKRLREDIKEGSDPKFTSMPGSGVLLTGGIEDFAAEMQAKKDAADAEAAEMAARRRHFVGEKQRKGTAMGLLSSLRRKANLPPELDQSPRPPTDLLAPVEPSGAMKAVPDKVKPNPPSKPAWPRPIRYRLVQLPALLEFAIEVPPLSSFSKCSPRFFFSQSHNPRVTANCNCTVCGMPFRVNRLRFKKLGMKTKCR
jgi:hypothetical protein